MTAAEILARVDPDRIHESDTSFTHWYITDNGLENIYASTSIEDYNNTTSVWYLRNGKLLTEPIEKLNIEEDIKEPGFWYIDSDGVLTNLALPIETDPHDPGFWYIDENEGLVNPAIPDIPTDSEVGIWYIKNGVLTHSNLIDLATMGAFMTNQVVEKPILFPTLKKISEASFEGCISLREIYISPETEYSAGSFPEECEVKFCPCTFDTRGYKNEYQIGESLDLSGLQVTVTVDMSVISKNYKSYSYQANTDLIKYKSGFDSSTPGPKKVTLSYNDRYTIIITVTVGGE